MYGKPLFKKIAGAGIEPACPSCWTGDYETPNLPLVIPRDNKQVAEVGFEPTRHDGGRV